MQNNFNLSDKIFNQDHEQIVYCSDKDLGLKAIIGIHDTTLGPSIGGTRMWNYSTMHPLGCYESKETIRIWSRWV